MYMYIIFFISISGLINAECLTVTTLRENSTEIKHSRIDKIDMKMDQVNRIKIERIAGTRRYNNARTCRVQTHPMRPPGPGEKLPKS